MKPLIAAAVILLLSSAHQASAQDRTPLARGDVTGTAGWMSVNQEQFDSYNAWHGLGFFTAGAGWYWTDHVKTDVEVGISTERDTYGGRPVQIGGQQQFVPTRTRFSSSRVAVVQRYQFGRNQWFHPSLGVGVDIVRERFSRQEDPIFVYDQATRQSRLVRDAAQREEGHETDARAVAAGGFKAYLTPRAFFLGDMRVAFASRPEDILLRVGFGIDF